MRIGIHITQKEPFLIFFINGERFFILQTNPQFQIQIGITQTLLLSVKTNTATHSTNYKLLSRADKNYTNEVSFLIYR